MNFRKFTCFVGMVLIVGCSTKPADLESKTAAVVTNYSDNYQEIFRRVSNAAKRCLAGNSGGMSSVEVDAQLYSELGYGEITLSMAAYSARNYYWSAKIEKTDTGARMTVAPSAPEPVTVPDSW